MFFSYKVSEDMQKIALVTGGAGFIGSHLCERLVGEGYRVISLDNYVFGSEKNHVSGVEYRKGDTSQINQLVSEIPDSIFHLGEYSRVGKSIFEPERVWEFNMRGSLAVFEFWRKVNTHKPCRLVYAGSSTKAVGARADGVSGKDLSPYTWAKAALSELVRNHGRWYALPYTIVYFYNVYGPRERSVDEGGTFIETCRVRALAHQPHKISAPGTQTRIFTHVEDTIEGILLAVASGRDDEFGISSDDEFSLLDVAKAFGGDVEIVERTSTTRERSVANADALRALGWRPRHRLMEYVKRWVN